MCPAPSICRSILDLLPETRSLYEERLATSANLDSREQTKTRLFQILHTPGMPLLRCNEHSKPSTSSNITANYYNNSTRWSYKPFDCQKHHSVPGCRVAIPWPSGAGAEWKEKSRPMYASGVVGIDER
ncbi:unnamed protein product [Zymoseptoria tritici ST99CH_3D7]|uniref:Uncharacterized protein n=1 Tax=Zymoseptoria tritici (strain ST99CH_3D7) TaxID=1276538 RepID=A0A1X7S9N7_ZYMT9|nr:unnamed protein product [Zymoseptoria tritici ST99CH_3D7]